MLEFLLGICLLIVTLYALMRLYDKMGETPIAAFIPIYNVYTLFRLVWEEKYFLLYAGCFIVMLLDITFISAIATIAFLVVTIMLNMNLAKAFGKGLGVALGLTFLNTIFYLYLGLSSAEYEGNPHQPKLY